MRQSDLLQHSAEQVWVRFNELTKMNSNRTVLRLVMNAAALPWLHGSSNLFLIPPALLVPFHSKTEKTVQKTESFVAEFSFS